MQEDPSPTPPQFFLGRELEMYRVLGAILAKRLVIVTGEPGVGRSSLVCAVCHYINERKSTIMEIEQIFHVRMKEEWRGGNRCLYLIEALFKKIQNGNAKGVPLTDQMDINDMPTAIYKKLEKVKALIVFDHTNFLENDEKQDFQRFLSDLLEKAQLTKVLLTDRKPFGVPSIGRVVEHHYPLCGLSFSNSVRLFAKVCKHLHTETERQKFFDNTVFDKTQEDLLAFDSRCTARTNLLFRFLGNGMPSSVVQVASEVSEEEVRRIERDNFLSEFNSG